MRSALALTIFALTSIPTLAHAQSADFALGTRTIGMGQAYNANSEGPAGVFHNPAGISRKVMFGADFGYMFTPTGNTISAAIVDSDTNPSVSAGFGVGYFFNNDGTASALDFRLPISIPLVAERISVGVAGRYVITAQNDVQIQNGFTLDAGALFRVVDQFHLGVVGKNLIPLCNQTSCRGNTPVTVGGGMAYITNVFNFGVDVEVGDLSTTDTNAVTIEAGGEYVIQGMVPIRVGYRRLNATGTNQISAGLGWKSPAAAVDLSYAHDLTGNTIGNISLGFSAYLK